jgi:peptidoglycan/LPS O-acetylase OafA/YrhL
MKEVNRVYVFDFLRAIACLGVLVGHWACFHLNYEKFFIPIKIHQIGVGVFSLLVGI